MLELSRCIRAIVDVCTYSVPQADPDTTILYLFCDLYCILYTFCTYSVTRTENPPIFLYNFCTHSVPILCYFSVPVLYTFCTLLIILYLFCTCSVRILYLHSVLNFHQCLMTKVRPKKTDVRPKWDLKRPPRPKWDPNETSRSQTKKWDRFVKNMRPKQDHTVPVDLYY
jgi:hypothetical protein